MTTKAPEDYVTGLFDCTACEGLKRERDEARNALAAEKAARQEAEAKLATAEWEAGEINLLRTRHWQDCALNHGGAACDMGPLCGLKAAREAAEANAKPHDEMECGGGQCHRGCGGTFASWDDVFRCMDCGDAFHQQCLREHCAEHGDEKDRALVAAKEREAVLVALIDGEHHDGENGTPCDYVFQGGKCDCSLPKRKAALSSSPVDGAAREAEQAVIEAAEKLDGYAQDNNPEAWCGPAQALFTAVDRLRAARGK